MLDPDLINSDPLFCNWPPWISKERGGPYALLLAIFFLLFRRMTARGERGDLRKLHVNRQDSPVPLLDGDGGGGGRRGEYTDWLPNMSKFSSFPVHRCVSSQGVCVCVWRGWGGGGGQNRISKSTRKEISFFFMDRRSLAYFQ
jgi:hypothetical protein